MSRIFHILPIVMIQLFMLALGADTTTATATTTLIWVTGTDEDGVTRTTQSPYFQSFATLYTGSFEVSSGSIGLGSISGSVGEIRLYEKKTVSEASSAKSSGQNNVFINISNHTKGLMVFPLLLVGYVLFM